MRKFTIISLLFYLALFYSNSLFSQDWPPRDLWGKKIWTGNISASYGDPKNWNPEGVPVQETIHIPYGTKHSLSEDIPASPYVFGVILEPGVNLTMKGTQIGSAGYIWLRSNPAIGRYSNLILSDDTQVGGPMKIEPGSSLTASVINTYPETIISLESISTTFSSFISEGFIGKGIIHYKRHTNRVGESGKKGGNDLISSPLRGNFDSSFVTANPKLPEHPKNPGVYAFAPYNVTDAEYQNLDINPNNGPNNTVSIPFIPGKGYRAATEGGSAFIFSGLPYMQNVTIPILNGPTDKGSGWNLIGNPYPAYLKFEEFFELNKTQLKDEYQTIYGYNSSDDKWTTWNQATIDDPSIVELIAPGQGFFVKSKIGGGVITFEKKMRTTGSSDDFIVGRPAQKNVALSKLNLSTASVTRSTSIYFIEGTTKGIDLGYDAAAYTGAGSSDPFALYSNLVDNHSELDFAIQTLPYNDFNNVKVPLMIRAKAGSELRISIDDLSTIPSHINVYLEDKHYNSLTLLNDEAYIFKPAVDLKRSNRFNVLYSSKMLSAEDIRSKEKIAIYINSSPKNIVIKGQLMEETTADLYDIQGRLIMSKIFNPNNQENTMDITTIGTGVYVVKLKSDLHSLSQKLIIK